MNLRLERGAAVRKQDGVNVAQMRVTNRACDASVRDDAPNDKRVNVECPQDVFKSCLIERRICNLLDRVVGGREFIDQCVSKRSGRKVSLPEERAQFLEMVCD